MELSHSPTPKASVSAKIVVLSSFPPRQCGIATYAQDMMKAIGNTCGTNFDLEVCPLETNRETFDYGVNTGPVLNTQSEASFQTLTEYLNDSKNITAVLIQHEYGLFPNAENFKRFLEVCKKPIITVLHTVLPKPSLHIRQLTDTILAKSAAIIVMTETSRKLLLRDYDHTGSQIFMIPHGTHTVVHHDREVLKEKFGLGQKKVITTFGLLGPGKNIETTLRALPSVISEHPDLLFLVLGRTHPGIVNAEGERYRSYLHALVEDLGIVDHVKFVNKYLELNTLLKYLQSTDIYVFSSNDPNQAVSGTFAYALACGCPVISTPIPHALETMDDSIGRIIPFGGSPELSDHLRDLLRNPNVLEQMSINALQKTISGSWENVALKFTDVLRSVLDWTDLECRASFPLNLDHLYRMTDTNGIVQFAKLNIPDLSHGYTLDDNARGLVLASELWKRKRSLQAVRLCGTYLRFIRSCQRPNGGFYNYVDADLSFSERNRKENLDDANGRALWALGHFVFSVGTEDNQELKGMARSAEKTLIEFLANDNQLKSPRAVSFALKGIYYCHQTDPLPFYKDLLKGLALKLENWYNGQLIDGTTWYEGRLSYANAVLPEAMLLAGAALDDSGYIKIARDSMEYLLEKTYDGGMFRPVPNHYWSDHSKSSTLDPFLFEGGEQAIEAGYMVMALHNFETFLGDSSYKETRERIFRWFHGHNHNHTTIYNPVTGGCHDGLEQFGPNLNQGAESTLSYLLARLCSEPVFHREGEKDIKLRLDYSLHRTGTQRWPKSVH